MLHTDPRLLHISMKSQTTATLVYQTIAKYVPATNMPHKYHKYGIYHNDSMCIYEGRMPLKKPHIRLFPLMMQLKSIYADNNNAECQQ